MNRSNVLSKESIWVCSLLYVCLLFLTCAAPPWYVSYGIRSKQDLHRVSSVPALIKALSDEKPEVRKDAAVLLGNIGPDARNSIPALIESLGDKESWVRGMAVEALGKIGVNEELVKSNLVKTLGDENPGVSVLTAEALTKLGHFKESVPILIKALSDKDQLVRTRAADALRNIDPHAKEAVPALIGALGNEDPMVRGKAAYALKKIGSVTKETVPALIKALGDDNSGVRIKAAEVLIDLGYDEDNIHKSLKQIAEDEKYNWKGKRAEALLNKKSASITKTEKPQLPELQVQNQLPKIVITPPTIEKGDRVISAEKIKVTGVGKDKANTIAKQMVSVDKKILLNGKAQPAITDQNTSRERRLALVIGNADYTYGGDLANPVNDARDMKNALEILGFEVLKCENCSQKTMKRAMDEFGRKLKNYDAGLFFYAGHSVQVDGNNYLIPLDAKLENQNEVEYDCVRADRILAKMESAGSKTNIVILDSCRDNPFERSWHRGAKGTGLAFMNAPSGSLIAYSTSPGNIALDGTGRNSIYTSALLKHIHTPNITIEEVFKKVRATVIKDSGKTQTPWESTSLTGNFYFKKE